MQTPFLKWPQGASARVRAAGLPDGPPLVVLMELLTWWRAAEDNLIFVGVDKLCSLTGYPHRTLRRALSSIRKTGLLVHAGGGTRNHPNQWRVSPAMREILAS